MFVEYEAQRQVDLVKSGGKVVQETRLWNDATGLTAGSVQAAIDAMSGVVDEIVCMGDSVYEYRMCSETVGIIRRNGLRTILGNHDAAVADRGRNCRRLLPLFGRFPSR